MAEVVLERRAALRSNGEKIREVVRLKELQHHFISYRSKVFWTRKNHILCGVFVEEKSLSLSGWLFGQEESLSLSGWCFGGITFTFYVVYVGKRTHFHFLGGV